MGLSKMELADATIIIREYQERCNVDRKRHVLRQQFAVRSQRE